MVVVIGVSASVPFVPEVTVCFGIVLLRGNRSTKVSTTSFEGFASPHYPPLGEFGDTPSIATDHVLPSVCKGEAFANTSTAPEVAIVTLFPGISAAHLEALLAVPGLQGVVLRTFGAGNAPTDTGFLDVIGRAVERGINVIDVSQCLQGTVRMGQ